LDEIAAAFYSFAIGEHAGDKLDLRMPRLIRVNQMSTRLDGIC